MKLDTGKCAQCGRRLQHGFETDPCNSRFDGITILTRPYFCSDDCVDRAITNGVNAELDAWDDMLEQGKHTDYEKYYPRQAAFRAERPQRFDSKFAEATREYFNRYREERRQIEEEKNANDMEKARVKLLAIEARETTRAARNEERERVQAARKKEREEAQAARQREKDQAIAEKEAEAQRIVDEEAERLRPIPLQIPSDHSRYEGVHVTGPTGSGKTTLAQAFLIHDITRPDPPGLIVIDPKGTLIERLKSFKLLDPERLVIIDATHPQPAKLGLFVKSSNPAVNAEQIVNQAVSTYRYIFEAANFSFTAKQGILFENVVRLMFETGGTLSSLIDFLRRYHPKRADLFAGMLSGVSPELQEFFQYDFPDSYESTAKEINVRLQQIKQKPILRAMFDTTERHVDFFDCIQSGKIVLVNSGMSLDPDTSRMIGRFVIAMALNAVYVRATMPKSEWRPTFLLCDEFQEFVDAAKTPELLRFPREYNFGSMILHHNMYATEIDEAVRVAISTNTGIKFCADPRGMDLNYMARDFDCDPSFLRRQQVNDTHVHFAHVMRRKYQTAVSVKVPRGNLDQYPRRTEAEVAQIDRDNATKVHNGPEIIFVSQDEWADRHNSGHIDDTGRNGNVIYKIDENMQRWHIGGIESEPAASVEPSPTPSPPPTLPSDDPDHF